MSSFKDASVKNIFSEPGKQYYIETSNYNEIIDCLVNPSPLPQQVKRTNEALDELWSDIGFHYFTEDMRTFYFSKGLLSETKVGCILDIFKKYSSLSELSDFYDEDGDENEDGDHIIINSNVT